MVLRRSSYSGTGNSLWIAELVTKIINHSKSSSYCPIRSTIEFRRQEVDHRSRPAFSICSEPASDLRVLLKGFILNAKVEGERLKLH